MRYCFQILFISVVLLSAPVEAKQKVKYFAKLAGIITPMLEYNPRGEISEQKARTMQHYRVSYDSANRLQSIRYFHGDWPSNRAYFYAHEVRYQYAENQRIRRYFDNQGKPMGMWRHYYRGGEIHKEVFTINGDDTVLSIFDIQNQQIEVATGTYTFKSRKVDDKRFIQWQFKKDGSANVIFDYLPFEVSLITKDENGFLWQIIALAANSSNIQNLKPVKHPQAGFAEMRLDFDQWGNEMGWDFRDLKGQLVNRKQGGSDPGYAAWRYSFQWTNRQLGQFTKLTENYFDSNNQTFCKVDGICSVEMTLDSMGNITGQSFYNKNKQLIVSPDTQYARVEFTSNDKGLRTELRYYNADNQLRKQKEAIQSYFYDSNGKQIKVEKLDHKKQPYIETQG